MYKYHSTSSSPAMYEALRKKLFRYQSYNSIPYVSFSSPLISHRCPQRFPRQTLVVGSSRFGPKIGTLRVPMAAELYLEYHANTLGGQSEERFVFTLGQLGSRQS